MIKVILAVFLVLAIAISIPSAFAQHHGGAQAPPVSFGAGEVTVSTSLNPPDFIPNKGEEANLKIRFFDAASNQNIENVTYRVQIFQGNDLVANKMFFDADGELDIIVQPNPTCDNKELWKCTTYYGEEDLIIPNAISSSPSSTPTIAGPVFDKSGEYTIKTAIIGAVNPKTVTEVDINFETVVVLPHEQVFTINAENNQYPISVKNFQDPITEFKFDENTNSISFVMNVDSHHGEIKDIKNYFEIPKEFTPFKNAHAFSAEANNVKLSDKNIHFDQFSKKETNIIHFVIEGDELSTIKESESSINFTIIPDESAKINTKEINFDNGYKAVISYDSEHYGDEESTFLFAFFEPSGELVENVRYGYGIKDPIGNETVNTGGNANLLGINLPNGVDTRMMPTPTHGQYNMQVVILGIGQTDFDQFMFKEFGFELTEAERVENTSGIVQEKDVPKASSSIPDWIKNNAGWWAEGAIEDDSFIQGIQFLIKENLIVVDIPETTASTSDGSIPDWIKNNAGWWAEGAIEDDSFIQGIQFLIKEGIIVP